MQYKAKYKDLNINIPQEKRKEINEKILYMIDNNLCEEMGFNKEILVILILEMGELLT